MLGLGYIGFPTACLMAKAGHQVIGVDIRESVIERLRNGKIHITGENGLGQVARSVLESGALTVSTMPVEADAFIVCVPTPLKTPSAVNAARRVSTVFGSEAAPAQVAAGRDGDGWGLSTALNSVNRPTVDLSYLQSAVEAIAPVLRAGNLVIVESTVPPGTTERVVLPIFERYGWSRDDIMLAHAPERVIPGAVMREMIENDRVVGGLTVEATEAAKQLYASLVKGQIYTTNATTAEFVKLIENTYRDVNIALANELARVAEHLGIDVQQAIAMANRHPRVNILNPGPGVGGHCIPVDPYFIIEQAPELTLLMQAARSVNDGMIDHVANIVYKLSQRERLRRWIILGAAYKADVSDERNSPSLEIAQRLKSFGLSIAIHDPYVERFQSPLDEMIAGAEGLLLLTDHSFYLKLDPGSVGRQMSRRFLVDTRLRLDADEWEKHGFVVRRLGDGRLNRVPLGG